MGIFNDIGDFFGEQTGFGGNGNPNPHNVDPLAYSELYNEAMGNMKGAQGQINAVGTDPASAKAKTGLLSTLNSQVSDFDNNAAGAKNNFMSDMSRGFSADSQNLARSKGGTGSFANAMHNPGSMYDSEARAEAGGLNQLTQQATQQLGSLTGSQNTLYNQDLNKAGMNASESNAMGQLSQNELNARRGIMQTNSGNTVASEQAGAAKRGGTLGTVAGGITSFFADGGRVSAPRDASGPSYYGGFFGKNQPGGDGSGLGPLIKKAMGGMGGAPTEGMEAGGVGEAGAEAGGLAELAPLVMAAFRGGRAEVPGDSTRNDKIPAILSEDEVVVPRSITKAPHPAKKAGKFVESAMRQPGGNHSLAALAKKKAMSYGGRC